VTVAYPTITQDARISTLGPVLIAGDNEAAIGRAAGTLSDGGLGSPIRVLVEDAEARLDRQAQLDLLWLELDELGPPAEALLGRVNRDAEEGRYSIVAAVPASLIDPLSALLTAPRIELVIGRSEMERATALALAQARFRDVGARDSASDESASRLRQLSEEVSRIASTLARLSGGTGGPAVPSGTEAPPMPEMPQVAAEAVRAVIKARRQRAEFLPADLFADPTWDMLLDLLQAELVQHRVPVSSLCLAAAVPATTAASLDQDDDRQRTADASQRPARRPPSVHRDVATDEPVGPTLLRGGEAGGGLTRVASPRGSWHGAGPRPSAGA
jgi:hypothetical protein